MKCIVIPKLGPATPIGAGVRVGLGDGAGTVALGGWLAAARVGAGALEGALEGALAAVGAALAAVVDSVVAVGGGAAVGTSPGGAVDAPQALRRMGESSSPAYARNARLVTGLDDAPRALDVTALLP